MTVSEHRITITMRRHDNVVYHVSLFRETRCQDVGCFFMLAGKYSRKKHQQIRKLHLCVFDGFAGAEEFLVDESDASVNGAPSRELGLLTPVHAVRHNHQSVVLTPDDTERIRYRITCGRTAERVICNVFRSVFLSLFASVPY